MLKTFASLLPLFLSLAMAQQLVLTHVTVIDATGARAQPDMSVTITGNRISAIGRSGQSAAPRDAQVVDATGKFLIPGLWDMHVHPRDKEYLGLFIANGITGIRVMWGSPDHYASRKSIEAGQLIGPHMTIASPIVDGPVLYWPGSIGVADEAQARRAVDQAKQFGADFVKIYQNLPRDLFFAIADEAKKQGIPFAGHVPLSVTAEEASDAGQRSFEHLVGVLPACSNHSDELLKGQQADLADGIAAGKVKFWGTHVRQSRKMMLDTYSPEKAAALSALLKRNGTWQCPTLTLLHMFAYGDDPAFRNDSRLKYIPASDKASWDPAKVDGMRTAEDFAFSRSEFQRDLEVVGTMQKAGVGILAGTDAGNPFCFPGFGLHDELGFLVQAGLTPMQALQAATSNPARFLGKEKDLGTVQPGKIADLVLLDANPLEDIGNTRKIAAVIYGGQLLPRAMLNTILARTEALANRKPVSETMLATLQQKGVDAAVQQYRDLEAAEPAAYDFSENQLITLGYQLIRMKRFKDAIEVFKLAVEVYPKSYNTYDSLAEAYMDAGDQKSAIANYRQSLTLNPGNQNAVRMLKKLAAQ
jgi:imidazolonepropionase-like amidohydrolase